MTVGHVHGRFQPFHEGHLAYLQWAAGECDELLVGLTNADPSHVRDEDADPERSEPRNNPFRYHERDRMVRAAIGDTELAPVRETPVRVLPFPVNRPDLWEHYVPADAVHFLRVLEKWHEVKADRLREHGREVRTVRAERTVSGTDIRRRMAAGDDSWRGDVPDAVAAVLDDIDGPARVRELW